MGNVSRSVSVHEKATAWLLSRIASIFVLHECIIDRRGRLLESDIGSSPKGKL